MKSTPRIVFHSPNGTFRLVRVEPGDYQLEARQYDLVGGERWTVAETGFTGDARRSMTYGWILTQLLERFSKRRRRKKHTGTIAANRPRPRS